MFTPLPVITGLAPDGAAASIRTSALNSEVIKRLTFTNKSAAPANLTVLIKESGGTARECGPVAKTLQASESVVWYWAEGHALGTGDELQALTSVASAITYEVTLAAVS